MSVSDSDRDLTSARPTLFRTEAIRHYAGGAVEGEVLRLPARWTRWVYRLVIIAFVIAVSYVCLASISLYAGGPAVVLSRGREDLTAHDSVVVEAVEVHSGQTVTAGQVLVRFVHSTEAEELARIDSERELLLGRALRDPGDQSARQQLTKLLADRAQAAARLERRTLRAPRSGRITDARIRAGQHLDPGAVVISLSGGERFTLLAMLPGHYRPELHPGQRLRLELNGYRYSYQDLVVRSVASQVIGPAEVRNALRPDIADAVTLAGPVTLVEAELTQSSFVVDHQMFNFFDGMLGTAEVRVRSERIAFALLPELRWMFTHETARR